MASIIVWNYVFVQDLIELIGHGQTRTDRQGGGTSGVRRSWIAIMNTQMICLTWSPVMVTFTVPLTYSS